MTKKETAEQKLLRIIEEGARESGQPTGQVAASSATATAKAQEMAHAVRGPSLAIPSTNLNIANLFSQIQSFIPTGKPLGMRQINMALVVLILVSLFALIETYRRESKVAQQPFDFRMERRALDRRLASSVMPTYDDIHQFLDAMSRRNIFRPYEAKIDDAALSAISETPQITSKLQEFRLVGISWLDSPDTASVMIEQVETGVTYFLRQGESFNELTVQKIYADRVIFGYQNQEMEIRL